MEPKPKVELPNKEKAINFLLMACAGASWSFGNRPLGALLLYS
jgi:hypothetical protein